jgi:hypothetical protein
MELGILLSFVKTRYAAGSLSDERRNNTVFGTVKCYSTSQSKINFQFHEATHDDDEKEQQKKEEEEEEQNMKKKKKKKPFEMI